MTGQDHPRTQLKVEPAPPGAAPTVVSFSLAHRGGTLTIAYVPDREILVRASLMDYLATLAAAPPEQTVSTIANDIANELVPKWHRVSLVLQSDGITHRVAIEDRQPGWDHPSLLTALPHAPGDAP